MGTGGWVLMVLVMLVVIALVVALAVWVVSHQRQTERSVGRSAAEALDHRLVSGEISAEQYDELRGRLDTPRSRETPPVASG